MPTTGSKGKPVLAGTDAFAPYTHINSAVNWAETFANVRNVADSTAMNALASTDLWTGLTVYHTGGTYAGTFWTYNGSAWKMNNLGDGTPRFEGVKSSGTTTAIPSTTWTAIASSSAGTTTTNTTRGGMSLNTTTGAVTVPVAGRYNMYVQASWTANGTGNLRGVRIIVDGVPIAGTFVPPNASAEMPVFATATGVNLNANAVVTFQVYQSSGSGLTLTAAAWPLRCTIDFMGS